MSIIGISCDLDIYLKIIPNFVVYTFVEYEKWKCNYLFFFDPDHGVSMLL